MCHTCQMDVKGGLRSPVCNAPSLHVVFRVDTVTIWSQAIACRTRGLVSPNTGLKEMLRNVCMCEMREIISNNIALQTQRYLCEQNTC